MKQQEGEETNKRMIIIEKERDGVNYRKEKKKIVVGLGLLAMKLKNVK